MRRISQHKEEQLFEVLRNVPTQLSQQDVGKILDAFPVNIESKHWFYRFHLNTILFIVGLTALWIGSSLLFSDKEKTVLSSFQVNTSVVNIETNENTLQKINKLSTLEKREANPGVTKNINLQQRKKQEISTKPQTNNNPITDKRVLVNMQSDLELVLQKSLDSNHLERVLEKDANGFFRPITLVTNHHFFKKINLSHAGQKVNIVYSKDTTGIENAYVEITKLDIEKEKALFEFQYKGALVRIELMKKQSETSPAGMSEWIYRAIEIKGQPIGAKMGKNKEECKKYRR